MSNKADPHSSTLYPRVAWDGSGLHPKWGESSKASRQDFTIGEDPQTSSSGAGGAGRRLVHLSQRQLADYVKQHAQVGRGPEQQVCKPCTCAPPGRLDRTRKSTT